MTMQVTRPEPAMEPSPASKKATAGSAKNFDGDALSPVSKLEAARKFAQVEQEKRVAAASARLTAAKKEHIVKRVEIEQHVGTHSEEQHVTHVVEETKESYVTGVSTFARRLLVSFSSISNNSKDDEENVDNQKEGEEIEASPTRSLLQATRSKLNALIAKNAEDEEDLPSTNYHLKQLGLVSDKINIYAPVHEQQQEIRRRRQSAIRCQEKYMQEVAELPMDDGYDSADDSDYVPEADDEQESGSEDESDDDVDEEEIRRLVEDQSEFDTRVAEARARLQEKKRAKAKKADFAWVPTKLSHRIAAVVALLLVLVFIVFIAEHESGACYFVVTSPTSDDSQRAVCNVVMSIYSSVLRVQQALMRS
ncbi:hypothetical protein Poli38472_000594 [Pythium oligandrum]|uniref:Uncharacterized protein n=1 Tax=Pythium oligandrum TaxID=41045 RepID=A0A8K1CE25_PYTOL|nr:hypothetical protein Poli38472_000594 [Pythium oligandrum]|eukprot:TMW60552.1 hypothetical protein Poli38472_000594 [Pythium oligandrum]